MQKHKEPLLFKRNLRFISQNLKDLDEAKIKFMHMFHLTWMYKWEIML